MKDTQNRCSQSSLLGAKMGKISIFEYDNKCRLSSINLLEQTFGLSEENFAWRYESPEMDSPIILCAADEGNVVSFNSWLEWDFEARGARYKGYQSGNSATDMAHRRMGVFASILKAADAVAANRGIDFLFGFPGEMSYGALVKTGYSAVGALKYKIRFIKPIGKFRKNTVWGDINEYSRMHTIEKEKISPVLDEKYLVWRYNRNPNKYDIIKFNENNKKAIFVLRRLKYRNQRLKVSWDEVMLLDCMFTCQDKKFLSHAFEHIDSLYRRRALWIRSIFNENCARGLALKPHFHISARSSREILMIKFINKELDRSFFLNIENWDVMPHVIDAW